MGLGRKQFRLVIYEINEIEIRKYTNNLQYTNAKHFINGHVPSTIVRYLKKTKNLQGRQLNRKYSALKFS